MIFESQLARPRVGSLQPETGSRLQCKCACGGTPGPTGECEQCKRKRLALQGKLTINQPGDRYEQEADRVADIVARGGVSGRAAISSLAKGSAVQRDEPAKPKTEEEKYKEAAKDAGEAFLETAPGKEIKKKAEEIGDAFISTLPGKIITGTKKKEEETVQRKALNDRETSGAPPIVHHVLAGGGQALDTGTRDFMESRFGYDFGSVRIHADALAGESARAVQAHGYTVGEHIVFDAGRYAPSTTEGKKLLAHELTHVVQQSGGNVEPRCQRQTDGPLLTGTHKPGAPSLRLVGAENIMGFNVTKAMCQCNEGDLLDRQIAKTDRASTAYRECGKTATSTEDLLPCVLPKVFGQQAGTKAPQVPPAGKTMTESSVIIQANEAEIKKRAELLNLPESGPCAELLRAGNLAHERQHVAQHEKVAAEQGPAFAAEYNRLVWDDQRMEKLRAKFPRETAQFENKLTTDVPFAVQREVEAYAQEKQFYTQAKAALGRICTVPVPAVSQPQISPVHPKPTPLYQPRTGFESEVEKSGLQRCSNGNALPNEQESIPAIVHDVISSGGQPLDPNPRTFMEERFGNDFGTVRVHTDARASESARAVNAIAYTVGRDVVFSSGQYSVATDAGRRLLAHELTHTIQQSKPVVNCHSSQLAESEADTTAARILAGVRIGPISGVSPTLARQKSPIGTPGKLRAIPDWGYIVYGDEIRLRYYDKGPEGKPDVQIGTIPWVTNNPGNLTISPNITPPPKKFPIPEICKSTKKEDEVSPDSLQALPINLGAAGLYACRYAIFPSLEAGMAAIVPHLKGIAEKSGNHAMTVEQALRNFKGLEKGEKEKMEQQRKAGLPVVDVRDTYVAAIKAYMTKMMTINEAMEIGETPEGLSVNELKEIMKDIQQRIKTLMGKKMLEVTDADTDMRHIVRGLIQKEGYAAPPGVIFRCSGFEIGSANLYDGHQKALMTALQSSSEAKTELSAALGCTGGK